ncbi:MAG: hypothetical protein WBH88_07545 [Candidatus Methanoculleus thermohydrogenotrophicum]|nr:hypothetical protein [Candidatus Methanoculleus thermohydrogenotrophicum]
MLCGAVQVRGFMALFSTRFRPRVSEGSGLTNPLDRGVHVAFLPRIEDAAGAAVAGLLLPEDIDDPRRFSTGFAG